MTLRVGLVGAGPWAGLFHAPMLASGPQTSLAAVWARRPEAAEQLATSYGAQHAASFDDLLAACDAVAFAVPPPVQATAGAPSRARGQAPPAGEAAGLHPAGGGGDRRRGGRVRGAEPDGPAQPLHRRGQRVRRARRGPGGPWARWRASSPEPHSRAARSPRRGGWSWVRCSTWHRTRSTSSTPLSARSPDITAVGDPLRWLGLTLEHQGGAVSQAALSITAPGDSAPFRIEARTEDGPVIFDGARSDDDPGVQESITSALAEAVSSGVATHSTCIAGCSSSAA